MGGQGDIARTHHAVKTARAQRVCHAPARAALVMDVFWVINQHRAAACIGFFACIALRIFCNGVRDLV